MRFNQVQVSQFQKRRIETDFFGRIQFHSLPFDTWILALRGNSVDGAESTACQSMPVRC